jgi:hypothetical protein
MLGVTPFGAHVARVGDDDEALHGRLAALANEAALARTYPLPLTPLAPLDPLAKA